MTVIKKNKDFDSIRIIAQSAEIYWKFHADVGCAESAVIHPADEYKNQDEKLKHFVKILSFTSPVFLYIILNQYIPCHWPPFTDDRKKPNGGEIVWYNLNWLVMCARVETVMH